MLKEYARYYEELLKDRLRPAENNEEEEIERIADKKFLEIVAEGKTDRE